LTGALPSSAQNRLPLSSVQSVGAACRTIRAKGEGSVRVIAVPQ
jgi:hypothetical protein